MDRLIDSLEMTIANNWDVKPQTKQFHVKPDSLYHKAGFIQASSCKIQGLFKDF